MCCRFVLVLLFMCVADNEARVVKSFEGECSQFCYKKRCPLFGPRLGFPNTFLKICQQYKGQDYFATSYMRDLRIPLFSAYRLDEFECNNTQNPRLTQWFVEPQLLFPEMFSPGMCTEGTHGYLQFLKLVQAVNGDYKNTHYDRGHLNPSFYQCDNARTATFTLTNAVPQYPYFNQRLWFPMETMSKQIMRDKCSSQGDERYFVTGVIPSDTFIPQGENRVNIPYGMWTAACCNSNNQNKSFSFSYAGVNEPDSHVYAMPVRKLERLLIDNGIFSIIFNNDCFPLSDNSEEALSLLTERAKLLQTRSDATYKNKTIHPSLIFETPEYTFFNDSLTDDQKLGWLPFKVFLPKK